MTNAGNFNETKKILTETLQEFNLADTFINQLLTEQFINNLVVLQQQEPENDEFMSLMRTFSETQNLDGVMAIERSVENELGQEGYFSKVLQFFIDAWKNVNFPPEPTPLSNTYNNEITSNNVRITRIIIGAVLGILKVPSGFRIIFGSLGISAEITIAVQEQDKKIWDIIESMNRELLAIQLGYFETAEVTKSPLVVDLDGDGVETLGTQNGVYFDHDGNGFAEKSGWVGKDDGILVRDVNNNGTIDNGTELFGNNSVLGSGANAINGFEALQELDSNGDGIFNSSDASWNTVKVWKDSNQNGLVDSNELLSLEQADISGINLNYTEQEVVDTNGNAHAQTGTIVRGDGTSGTITDVWFDTDTADTVDRTEVTIPEDVKLLPDVAGFGNVHSLQVAMALDESGQLKTLVEQFLAENNVMMRNTLLNNIIYHWAGVQNVDPKSRIPEHYSSVSNLGDARKLETLEEFMGRDYLGTLCSGLRDPNPNNHAALILSDAFEELKSYVKYELLTQRQYINLLESIKLTYNSANETWNIDVTETISTLESLYETDEANTFMVMYELAQIIKHYSAMGAEVVAAFNALGHENSSGFDKLLFDFGKSLATEGNDVLHGDENSNIIFGMRGDDKIYGNNGNDTLIGGDGNDYLVGGDGQDIYKFAKGFGKDEINSVAEDGVKDVIVFDESISAANVSLGRQDFDLVMTVTYDDGTPADSIRVYSYFQEQGQSSATISEIRFADATVWDYEYVVTHWNSIPGIGGGITLEGNEKINALNGTQYDDVLIGHGGNDSLDGGNGNDIINGGMGTDYLSGKSGDDVYIWNWGDGFDTISDSGNHDSIVFGKGISFKDLVFRGRSYDLLILVKGDESQGMKISDFFRSINYKIENLKFYDGSVVHLSDIGLTLQQSGESESVYGSEFSDVIYGAGGDDYIFGRDGNDIINGGLGEDRLNGENGNDLLVGGKGNDNLDGGSGQDTYVYNLGDGLDTIYDTANFGSEDIIKFGEGIEFNDISFRAEGNDLRIILNGSETEGLIIKQFFYWYTDDYKNKILNFADGSRVEMGKIGYELKMLGSNSLNATKYNDIIHTSNSNSTVKGRNGNDVIYGGNGADTLNGGEGNDELYGGLGEDHLNGENGNDLLVGGKGNDNLDGGSGQDTYVYNLGDGLDTIYDTANFGSEDIIKFGEGIEFNDISFRADGDDLRIILNGSETEGLIINQFFYWYTDDYKNKTLNFADGTSVDLSTAELSLNTANGAMQLVQAMNLFGAESSASTEIGSGVTDVSEMYNLACNSDLTKKAA